jgi:hypothetical protein
MAERKLALLIALNEEGDGYELWMDDVEVGPNDELSVFGHFTHQILPKRKFDPLAFSDGELRLFGHSILSRLNAYRKTGTS